MQSDFAGECAHGSICNSTGLCGLLGHPGSSCAVDGIPCTPSAIVLRIKEWKSCGHWSHCKCDVVYWGKQSGLLHQFVAQHSGDSGPEIHGGAVFDCSANKQNHLLPLPWYHAMQATVAQISAQTVLA